MSDSFFFSSQPCLEESICVTAAFFDGEDFTVKVVFVDEVKGLEVGIEGMLGIEGIAGIEGVYGESVECRDEATSD